MIICLILGIRTKKPVFFESSILIIDLTIIVLIVAIFMVDWLLNLLHLPFIAYVHVRTSNIKSMISKR